MSGGHFEGSLCLVIEQFENDLKWEGGRYKAPTQNMLKHCLKTLREAEVCLKGADYLFSGDYGEESFIKSTKEDLKKLNDLPEIEMGIPCCETCKNNREKSLRLVNGDYKITGCIYGEDLWPDNGKECYCYQNVEDYN